MQVVCGNCQLSFDAPEGATGLVCPICRGPLRPQAGGRRCGGGEDGPGVERRRSRRSDRHPERAGVSARVEVLAADGDVAVGEVHLLAGGVSDALYAASRPTTRSIGCARGKPTRFRVEQRLPNPADGDLTNPGAEAGTLEGRALAHLMRYCEDYVITCSIEVWRGNETARVEYKRGEISGVTVGGIDAPERLAEVMQWSSGNYRLIVPPFKLPAAAPKRAAGSRAHRLRCRRPRRRRRRRATRAPRRPSSECRSPRWPRPSGQAAKATASGASPAPATAPASAAVAKP